MFRRTAALLALIAVAAALSTLGDHRVAEVTSVQAPLSANVASVSAEPIATVSSTEALPSPLDCPSATLPLLDISAFPSGSEHGGATPAAAFSAAHPDESAFELRPFGQRSEAPVWITARGRTYIATILPDRSWFVASATFVRCMAMPTAR